MRNAAVSAMVVRRCGGVGMLVLTAVFLFAGVDSLAAQEDARDQRRFDPRELYADDD
jgi:hypothetical protein